MFGDVYQPTDYNVSVPEGTYDITLGDPQQKNKGGYDCVEIPITIIDNPSAQPKVWTIFDCNNKNDPESVQKWNAQMTKFFDAFGISPNHGMNIRLWKGKRGKVFIGKDKNGYMQVKYAVIDETQPKANQCTGPATQIPPPQMQMQQQYQQRQRGFSQPPTQMPFSEEIPF